MLEKKYVIAKESLDTVIAKARIHLYKPIQIAEILHKSRNKEPGLDVTNLSTYRNPSKRWRDEVSIRLVGRVSTSSQKFQDNIFERNAVPPTQLAILDEYNKHTDGMVEAYIYCRMQSKFNDLQTAYEYIRDAVPAEFQLEEFLNIFERRAGLKRSVDKAYEIVVYALFSTLVNELDVNVTLQVGNDDQNFLTDFEKFTEYVLGISSKKPTITVPAKLYRAGVTNAADRGLDIWTNYGPAVQVKHLGLNQELAEDISSEVLADDVVIVCKTADAKLIESLLRQLGLGIRGIITQSDLEYWYSLCLNKYKDQMGKNILSNLMIEFQKEFPVLTELKPFMDQRNYNDEMLNDDWKV